MEQASLLTMAKETFDHDIDTHVARMQDRLYREYPDAGEACRANSTMAHLVGLGLHQYAYRIRAMEMDKAEAMPARHREQQQEALRPQQHRYSSKAVEFGMQVQIDSFLMTWPMPDGRPLGKVLGKELAYYEDQANARAYGWRKKGRFYGALRPLVDPEKEVGACLKAEDAARIWEQIDSMGEAGHSTGANRYNHARPAPAA